jgi:hypothetical protein
VRRALAAGYGRIIAVPFVPVARPLEEGAEPEVNVPKIPSRPSGVRERGTVQPVQRYSPELPWRPRVSPPSVEDRDACAIYASVRKDATPSREPVTLSLENIQKMLHRAGNVDG